jgi:hypothetical protein
VTFLRHLICFRAVICTDRAGITACNYAAQLREIVFCHWKLPIISPDIKNVRTTVFLIFYTWKTFLTKSKFVFMICLYVELHKLKSRYALCFANVFFRSIQGNTTASVVWWLALKTTNTEVPGSISGHSLGLCWGSCVWNGVHSASWSDKLSSYLNK